MSHEIKNPNDLESGAVYSEVKIVESDFSSQEFSSIFEVDFEDPEQEKNLKKCDKYQKDCDGEYLLENIGTEEYAIKFVVAKLRGGEQSKYICNTCYAKDKCIMCEANNNKRINVFCAYELKDDNDSVFGICSECIKNPSSQVPGRKVFEIGKVKYYCK